MANECQTIRHCPAGLYRICEAYKKDINCWEIAEKPCCKRKNLQRCQTCWVFEAHQKARSQETAAGHSF